MTSSGWTDHIGAKAVKSIFSDGKAKRLYLATVIMLGLCSIPTIAEENSLELSANISMKFESDPKPIRANFEGQDSITIDDAAKLAEQQKIPLKYDLTNPQEAQLIVTVTWPDASFDSYSFSFIPSHLEKDIDIFFFGDATSKVAKESFNEEQMTSLSKAVCNQTPTDRSHLMHQYRQCSMIFEAFDNNNRRHFKAAFRALKGAFYAYYALIAERDIGLARDLTLENQCLSYENEAAINNTLRVNIRDLGLNLGYFKGMIDNIGTSMTNRFARLSKDVQNKALLQKKSDQLRIETELLRKRFEVEQARRQTNSGRLSSIINGIGQSHFNAIQHGIFGL